MVERRDVMLFKDTECLHRRGLKYVESKNCWLRSQGYLEGDRNLAEDPVEQSKNRKMHRHASRVIKTKFRLSTHRVSFSLCRLRKGSLCLQSCWQKQSLHFFLAHT